jgi:uncharacterized protein YhfF
MRNDHIWTAFEQEFPELAQAPREEWAFGVDASLLAELVVAGKKTATSSYFASYLFEQENIPSVGDVSLILDDQAQPKVIVFNTQVVLQPYHEVDERIGYLEGEGTRDLAYWREVHEPFFTQEAAAIGRVFSTNDLIVTEFFKVLKVL